MHTQRPVVVGIADEAYCSLVEKACIPDILDILVVDSHILDILDIRPAADTMTGRNLDTFDDFGAVHLISFPHHFDFPDPIWRFAGSQWPGSFPPTADHSARSSSSHSARYNERLPSAFPSSTPASCRSGTASCPGTLKPVLCPSVHPPGWLLRISHSRWPVEASLRSGNRPLPMTAARLWARR